MQLVRAGFCNQVDDCTCCAAQFRRRKVGGDSNFLHGIDRRTHADGANESFVVVHAVEQIIIHLVGLAVG